jgi:hypothetical protein
VWQDQSRAEIIPEKGLIKLSWKGTLLFSKPYCSQICQGNDRKVTSPTYQCMLLSDYIKINQEDNMSQKALIVLLVIFVLLVSGCQSPGQGQGPAVSPTANVVAPPPQPTETALPLPTETLMPTPTDTPLPTATPGPIVVKDDFSSQGDNWGNCEHCEWKDGALFFGPYKPVGNGTDQIFYVICETCGLHTYYRVAADVTFADGYGDRTFGILAGIDDEKKVLGAGAVTTLKHALYETFDYPTKQWGGTFKKFNVVGAGKATNRVEVEIKPSSSVGQADIYINVNGENVITLLNQSANSTWAGLYLGWHSVGVAYDNFEYEEIPTE